MLPTRTHTPVNKVLQLDNNYDDKNVLEKSEQSQVPTM